MEAGRVAREAEDWHEDTKRGDACCSRQHADEEGVYSWGFYI